MEKNKQTVFDQITKSISDKKKAPKEIMQEAVDLLRNNFPLYNWVGIYLVEGNELVLAVWNGPQATQHTRIPIGQGICGAAAASGKTEVVDDVSKDNRYLVCFSSTKSEIVVPIKKGNKVIGEIDIDSNETGAFKKGNKVIGEIDIDSNETDAFNINDIDFLENVASRLAEIS